MQKDDETRDNAEREKKWFLSENEKVIERMISFSVLFLTMFFDERKDILSLLRECVQANQNMIVIKVHLMSERI